MQCLNRAPSRVLGLILGGLLLLVFARLTVQAQDPKTFEITLKGQTFTPAEVNVPAGEALILKLKNENDAPAEFESKDMKFEKVVAGHAEIVVKVKPLPGGTFEFWDEYHEDTARGTVVSK